MRDQPTNIPSGLKMKFNNDRQVFNDYLLNAEDIIRKANCDITHQTEKEILNTIAPKAFYPKHRSTPSRGVLLIHGLLDSCAIMSSLYAHYVKKGYFVKTILLPGHGTRSADLMDVKWEEWVSCCQFAIDSFKQEVDELYVLGLSTGACLAAYFALNHSSIDKLVLFAPAFKLKANISWAVSLCQRLNQSLPFPIKQWILKKEENIIGKYQSIATNGVYQLLQLMLKTTPRLLKEQLQQPQLMILSGDDETISNEKALACFKAQHHPLNQLLIFSNGENTLKTNNTTVMPSCLPEENILNFSHICLTVSPTHALYGKTKSTDSNQYLGANTPANMINYHFKRLSYNPHFDKMMSHIDSFLEGSSS